MQARGLFLVGLMSMLGPAGAADAPPGKPNIVLITVDTTRADRLGCYGSDSAATPNLDKLARTGARFEQAQSPAPITIPAHASMMTGLVPRRHGARDNALYPLPEGPPALAGLLGDAGYDTAAFVSSVVLDRRAGLARGFAHYDDRVRIGRRSAFNYKERAASQVNAAVYERLPELSPPFFLWVHYFDPHLPYVPPAPYDKRFADRPYDGEIAFMDHEIGSLLDRVRARFPNSIVVVAGDHGESLGEHGEAAHGVFLYQSTQRVPLIFAGPGIPRGRVVEQRVGLVDLMPTMLELAGVGIPEKLDGRSLLSLLGKRPRWKSRGYEMESLFPALAYDWAPLRALIRDDRVLIDAPRPESYDLREDPAQKTDLGTGGARARALLNELRRHTAGDELVSPEYDDELAERRMKLSSLGYVGGLPEDESSSIDPKDGIAFTRVLDAARASLQLGRADEAIGPLNELLRDNPGNLPARLTLLAAQLATGKATDAVATGRMAAARSPDDDLVLFNLANALRAESATRPEALAEARENYERSLRINPRRADAYLNFASLLVEHGEPERARELLVGAETAGVEDPDIATERGLLELLAGRTDTAIRYFEEALRLNPYAEDTAQALRRLRATRSPRRSPPPPGSSK